MSLIDWAKREVEIACEKENPDRKEGEFDYGCACYESALKAFESLCNDGHSGFSIKMTQNILNKLINGQPLTPIEDTEEAWIRCNGNQSFKIYQCKRMSSLFKNVHSDGTVNYNDINRVYCRDMFNHNSTYQSGLPLSIINEMFPIQMPYIPSKPIEVVCTDFLFDKVNGDFDTVWIHHCIKEENGKKVTIPINRYFKEDKEADWIEIDEKEYRERYSKRIIKEE